MPEWFTSCDKKDEKAVRTLLIGQEHVIVRTILDDVLSQNYDTGRFNPEGNGVRGTGGRVVIHSTTAD